MSTLSKRLPKARDDAGGRSRTRTTWVSPGPTVRRYHPAALVPRPSGFTVVAPVTTWSLMPSFGYAGESGDP